MTVACKCGSPLSGPSSFRARGFRNVYVLLRATLFAPGGCAIGEKIRRPFIIGNRAVKVLILDSIWRSQNAQTDNGSFCCLDEKILQMLDHNCFIMSANRLVSSALIATRANAIKYYLAIVTAAIKGATHSRVYQVPADLSYPRFLSGSIT